MESSETFNSIWYIFLDVTINFIKLDFLNLSSMNTIRPSKHVCELHKFIQCILFKFMKNQRFEYFFYNYSIV